MIVRRRRDPVRGRLAPGLEPLEPRRMFAGLAHDPAAQDALRATLLKGVSSIADMGVEGTVAVFGDDAVSVLEDADQKTVIAAADDGRGRVVAAGKTGFADFAHAGSGSTANFYRNVIDWVSHGDGKNTSIVTDNAAAESWLIDEGFSKVSRRSDWAEALDEADVLITYLIGATPAEQHAVGDFLARGGGMFVGYNGWAFGYAGLTPLTSGGNAVLRRFGLSWTDDISWAFDGSILRGTPAGNALLAGAIAAAPANHTANAIAESTRAIDATFASVPADNPFITTVRRNVLENASTAVPTPDTPVDDSTEKSRLRIEAAVLQALPANELFAHRTADSWGEISADAPRVTRARSFVVSSRNAETQWLGTGLYAAPGDVVTVTLPAGLVNRGWSLKVGSHTDDISASARYARMPFGISRDFPIDSTTIKIGSVYGGLIYLVKPVTTAATTHTVSFANTLEAPTFVLGQTTAAQWAANRRKPAPYAELVSGSVIITLHADDIRTLANPAAVMRSWVTRMNAADDLAHAPVPRTRPERINDDLQISAGWMHAGYPVMAYGRNLANMVDSDPGDDWGFVHEFGHNHQSEDWTFDTEVEVTTNIFSMRSFDAIHARPTDGWAAMWTSAGRAAHVASFIEHGRDRAHHAADSLTTYAQLRAAFGWEPFRQFFRQEQGDSAHRPMNDQEKRDQWVIRFSLIVGRNLGPFFQAWGFDPSQEALEQVARLPVWSPLEAVAPSTSVPTAAGTPVTLDPRSGFVDLLADPLAVTFRGRPAHGRLVDNGDGTARYVPAAGFAGRVSLPFTIRNAHGGVASGTITVNVLPRDRPPPAPSGLIGTTAGGLVSLTWKPPVMTPGSAINDYLLQISDTRGTTWRMLDDGVSAAPSAVVGGLVAGRSYVFRVAAVNSAGTGAFSPRSAAVAPRTFALLRPPTGAVAAR